MIIDASSKERIEQFVDIVERIKSSRFVKETKRVSYQIHVGIGGPVEQEITGFDEEDLRSMLWDLRKLTLMRDGVYFPEICELLATSTADVGIISNVQKCKQFWINALNKTMISLVVDGKTDTGKETLDKWFYGLYAHEKQHAKDLKALGIGTHIHKTIFVFIITELIKIAAITANNAKIILNNDIQ